MDETANLGLSYIMPQQAQKFVTHNDALRDLDSIVQLSVLDRDLTAPPSSPATGDRYVVAASPTGAWTGHAGSIAAWQDDLWLFYAPRTGWRVWIADENVLVTWTGSAWLTTGQNLNPAPMVGVLTTADTTNRLAVKSNAVLFANDDVTPGTGNIRLAISKASAGKDACLSFQDGFSPRALLGLMGDDNFGIKTSPDGSTFYPAINVDKGSGHVGVGMTADGSSTLAVAGPSALFSNASGDFRATVSKSAAGQTASLLLQDASSGRAEFGLYGDDHFHLRVSPDGSSWTEAVYVNNASGKIGLGTNAPTSRLTVSSNAATLPTPASGTLLHIGNADGSAARAVIDAFGTGAVSPNLTFRRSRGTAASPSAVQAGDQILNVASFGYGATGYSGTTRAGFVSVAAENWTDTAQGTYFIISATPVGSASSAERLRVNGDGSLLVAGGTQTIFDANGIVCLRSYTVTGLPTAATAGQLIYVSNGTSNKRLAVSDGTNWRFPDGAIVS